MAGSPDRTTQLQLLLDQGDERAYAELLSIASARLNKLTRKMLRDFVAVRRWEQTDDVFQTAALRLHRSLASVKPESVREFFGLAAVQIRRTLIDLARHHYGPEGQAAHHQSGSNIDHSGNVDTPDTLADWAEFHELVDKLPDEEREVFQLLWYSGMTQREAAELLRISERTVLRRYNRAKIILRDTLHGDD
ncbi:MAG: sigma-70 family RNA polymerase sigma factor [Gimesia chilikensis]|uniref:sigma-70 family RNA polymerase sigma factor n=1 Tax=Gimesia chilikensis TaxID=2605989 RepID=UPI0037B2BDE2